MKLANWFKTGNAPKDKVREYYHVESMEQMKSLSAYRTDNHIEIIAYNGFEAINLYVQNPKEIQMLVDILNNFLKDK